MPAVLRDGLRFRLPLQLAAQAKSLRIAVGVVGGDHVGSLTILLPAR